jgi:hypothetical protein
MAESPQKNLVTRLADVGEEAIQRLGGAPGGDRLVGAVNTLRNRVDEMQKRLRGLDEVQERLASVEQRLDALEAASASGSGRASSSSRKKSQSSTAGGD